MAKVIWNSGIIGNLAIGRRGVRSKFLRGKPEMSLPDQHKRKGNGEPRGRMVIVMSVAVATGTLMASGAGATGHETVLYTFHGDKDGASPVASVIKDSTGAYYGTTQLGGGATACTGGCGTVYKLTSANGHFTETVLYRFKGKDDGAHPEGHLLLDKNGNLFGTASSGGSTNCTGGCGTVFELSPKASGGYAERTLHKFLNSPKDGANPQAALLELASGVLLGATSNGGKSGYGCYGPGNTCGTIFRLTPSGKGYKETIAYSFETPADASAPVTNLLIDGGSIWGVGLNGGTNGCVAPNYACGTVFSLTPVSSGYSESVITLAGWNGDYGPNPIGGLALTSTGILIGAAKAAYTANGGIFALTPGSDGYTQAYIYRFAGSPDGSMPVSAPIVDKAGNVYGTTVEGGAADCNCGTVYKLMPGSLPYTETILWTFERGAGGSYPYSSLLETADGKLIGTTSQGGSTVNCSAGCGTVFEVTP